MKRLAALLIALAYLCLPQAAAATTVKALKVTVLSTMLTDDKGIGEWGYAALVEVDGHRILFDTGARSDTVLNNARALGIDLSTVEDVILSHNHGDHTGGLMTLRREMMKRNPKALSNLYVSGNFFLPWAKNTPFIFGQRAAYEADGGHVILHDKPFELAPGVWLTGPVPRHTDEHNYGADLVASGAPAPDVPEDQALVFETASGPILLTGCGHAGVINLIDYARQITHAKTIYAVIGGLHLYEASDATLAWTAAKLKAAGLHYLLSGHCTGLEATWRLRQLTGLTRKTAVYGAVGATFELGKGIDPRPIAS